MKKRKMLLWAILFASANTVTAQESMVPDISYSYLDTLIDVAKAHYPQMKIMVEQVAISKTDIHKTEVGWLDALNISYFYRPADNTVVNPVDPYIFNGYQLGVNVNIGSLFQNPFAVKEARDKYKVAKLEEEQYNLTIEAEVKKRYFTYIAQKDLVKLRSKAQADAADMVKQLKYKFERGEANFDDYNKALMAETEQDQFEITAESEMLIAKSALEEMLGEKLENIH
jgi:outer membrane protein TolC